MAGGKFTGEGFHPQPRSKPGSKQPSNTCGLLLPPYFPAGDVLLRFKASLSNSSPLSKAGNLPWLPDTLPCVYEGTDLYSNWIGVECGSVGGQPRVTSL